MIIRLACPVCGAPLVHCEHIRSVGYQGGQIRHVRLYPDGRKVLRQDIPQIQFGLPVSKGLEKTS